jgi:hypothetical protein
MKRTKSFNHKKRKKKERKKKDRSIRKILASTSCKDERCLHYNTAVILDPKGHRNVGYSR